jgi:hypothetical protein
VASAVAVRVSGGKTLMPSYGAREAASPAARWASAWSSGSLGAEIMDGEQGAEIVAAP